MKKKFKFHDILLIVTLCIICVGLFSASVQIWDDAFMFTRYANNFLHDGKLAWNPDGEATFGLTSPLYLFVMILPIYYLTENPITTTVFASYLSGCIFLGIVVLMVLRHTNIGFVGKRIITILLLIIVTLPYYDIKEHFLSGMDTMFALAYLTMYFLLLKWHEKNVSFTSAIIVGVVGGMIATVRPELLLYASIIPLALFFFSTDLHRKRSAILILAVSFSMLGTMLWLARIYFSSPLPLPFYAKGLELYGAAFYTHFKYSSVFNFKDFVFAHRFLLAIITVSVVSNFRQWWRYLSPIERGILIATLLFYAYVIFFVVPIMGMMQRFHYPTLPAIIFLTIRSLSYIISLAPQIIEKIEAVFVSIPRQMYAAFILVIFLPSVYQFKVILEYPFHFDPQRHYASNEWAQGYWYGLDQISNHPSDFVLATTEVGLPGILHLDKTIIDLAGLNETDIAHHGFSAKIFFDDHRPDLIYMPHPYYEDMITQIHQNQFFLENYSYFSAQELNTDMGIALWQDSQYYSALLQMLDMRCIAQSNCHRIEP